MARSRAESMPNRRGEEGRSARSATRLHLDPTQLFAPPGAIAPPPWVDSGGGNLFGFCFSFLFLFPDQSPETRQRLCAGALSVSSGKASG